MNTLSFSIVTMFASLQPLPSEDVSGDLLGLAYSKRLHEMQYLALSKQIKVVRTSFASSNTTHASQDYLSDDAVQMMELTIAE